MKVQYADCKNPFCNEKIKCEKKYLIKVCLEHSEPKLQKHKFYEVDGEHNSKPFRP